MSEDTVEEISIQYKLQCSLGSITLIPFILVAIVYLRDWWKNKDEKQKNEENDKESSPIHFHFQLYLTCLIFLFIDLISDFLFSVRRIF